MKRREGGGGVGAVRERREGAQERRESGLRNLGEELGSLFNNKGVKPTW